jgi:hypothetical protein
MTENVAYDLDRCTVWGVVSAAFHNLRREITHEPWWRGEGRVAEGGG